MQQHTLEDVALGFEFKLGHIGTVVVDMRDDSFVVGVIRIHDERMRGTCQGPWTCQ